MFLGGTLFTQRLCVCVCVCEVESLRLNSRCMALIARKKKCNRMDSCTG